MRERWSWEETYIEFMQYMCVCISLSAHAVYCVYSYDKCSSFLVWNNELKLIKQRNNISARYRMETLDLESKACQRIVGI